MPHSPSLMAKSTVVLLLATAYAVAQDAPARIANAKPNEVRVLASTGLKASLDPVKAAAERAVGRPLVIEYGASKNLQVQIEGDAPFEATILTRDVIDAMIAKGKVVAGSASDIGHVVVSFAVKGESPKSPDIKTGPGIKALLLGARQVRWLGIGASAPTVNKMLDGLGIARALDGKAATDNVSQAAPQVAGAGEYEVLLNLNSELHPVNGWTILGMVPKAYQVPIVESVGIGAKGDPAAAKSFIAFLRTPEFEKSLIASGMTR